MKKVVLLTIVLLMAVSMCACSSTKKEESSSSVPNITTESSPEPSAQPTSVQIATVTTDGVNVRSSASTDGDVLTHAYEGDVFVLLADKATEGWCKIQYDDADAFISSDFVELSTVTQEQANSLLGTTIESTPSPSPESTESASETSSETSSKSSEDGQSR